MVIGATGGTGSIERRNQSDSRLKRCGESPRVITWTEVTLVLVSLRSRAVHSPVM